MKDIIFQDLKSPDDGEWRDDARCRKMGVTAFFTIPHNNSKAIAQVIEEALNICKGCSVRIQCLRFAVANDITHGIWGGMTALQRKRNTEEVSVMLSTKTS